MDLNADLGEGSASDTAIMPLINRVNIACGGHAGDSHSMQTAIDLALRYNIAIGAHPSYPDRTHFGRVETHASPAEIERSCRQQIIALAALVHSCGARLSHVKPHGALYHRVMAEAAAAQAFLRAVEQSAGHCAVMGLPDSVLQQQAEAAGFPYLAEMFADRRYEADGTLTPRSHPDALIADIEGAVAQVLSVLDRGFLQARTGEQVRLRADTVCVHGDGEHALALAGAIHHAVKNHVRR